MARKTVDYYLFLISPWAYLGTREFNRIASKHDLEVRYKPIAVMETFEKMGGVPPAKRHPSRQRFRLDELNRWSEFLDMPINLKPAYWPADQSLAAQMVLAAGQRGENAGALTDAILAAVWREERNIADEQVLADIATECGMLADPLIERARDSASAKLYQSITEEAHQRDVFGSPTWIYRDEIFWGQDRLVFLDRALHSG